LGGSSQHHPGFLKQGGGSLCHSGKIGVHRLTPTQPLGETMYVIDCGMSKATIYNSETDEVKTIKHQQILDLVDELPEGSLIVSEYAHLASPKREKSRAQVFEADVLLKFYSDLRDKGITLKLFPQQSTPRACNYSRLEVKTTTPKVFIFY
jgi:hypothetical protein